MYVVEVLFEPGEYGVFGFAYVYNVTVGASDGINCVCIVYGDVLQDGAGGGGVLVADNRQLLKMALMWRRGAPRFGGEAGPHQDVLQVGVFSKC